MTEQGFQLPLAVNWNTDSLTIRSYSPIQAKIGQFILVQPPKKAAANYLGSIWPNIPRQGINILFYFQYFSIYRVLCNKFINPHNNPVR